MSWKTNHNSGKKFQSRGRGIDADAFGNMRNQDGKRSSKQELLMLDQFDIRKALEKAGEEAGEANYTGIEWDNKVLEDTRRNVEIMAKYKGRGKVDKYDDAERDLYDFTFKRGNKKVTLKYGMSVVDTKAGSKPTVWDALALAGSYYSEDGFEDQVETKAQARGLQKIQDKLLKIFDSDGLLTFNSIAPKMQKLPSNWHQYL